MRLGGAAGDEDLGVALDDGQRVGIGIEDGASVASSGQRPSQPISVRTANVAAASADVRATPPWRAEVGGAASNAPPIPERCSTWSVGRSSLGAA